MDNSTSMGNKIGDSNDTRKIKVMANNKEEAINKVNDRMFKIFKLISVKEF